MEYLLWYNNNITHVQLYYTWLKFYFPLFQTHYYTLSFPKTKENKIYTKELNWIAWYNVKTILLMVQGKNDCNGGFTSRTEISQSHYFFLLHVISSDQFFAIIYNNNVKN